MAISKIYGSDFEGITKIMGVNLVTDEPRPFSPLDIDGCGLWLRSDVGVTKNESDQVLVWADQSGNGNNANFVDREVYLPPLWSVSSGVEFSRRQNHEPNVLDFNENQPVLNTSFTICSFHFSDTNFDPDWSESGLCLHGVYPAHFKQASAGNFTMTDIFDESNHSCYLEILESSSGWHTWSFVYNPSPTASLVVYLDGIYFAESIDQSGFLDATPLKHIGFNPVYGGQDQSFITKELLIYDSDLSTTDRQKVEEYLIDRHTS
jgi:hypothetical protein